MPILSSINFIFRIPKLLVLEGLIVMTATFAAISHANNISASSHGSGRGIGSD